MTPVEKFEYWIDWKHWGLAIAVDFRFRRLWGQLGPVGFGFSPYA